LVFAYLIDALRPEVDAHMLVKFCIRQSVNLA
jgi:hypothetical protein